MPKSKTSLTGLPSAVPVADAVPESRITHSWEIVVGGNGPALSNVRWSSSGWTWQTDGSPPTESSCVPSSR